MMKILFLCLIPPMVSLSAAEEASWVRLPKPVGRPEGFSQLGVDPGGIVWSTVGNRVYYWDGKSFRSPGEASLRSGMYLARFYGGSDRPLYFTQEGSERNYGEIYRLDDGEARSVTDFHYESSGEYPGLYVARDGRIVNWAGDRLRIFADGRWRQFFPGDLANRQMTVFDGENAVHVYSRGILHTIDGGNRLHSVEVATDTSKDYYCSGAALPGGKVLLVPYGGDRIFVFDAGTGAPVPLEGLDAGVDHYSFYKVIGRIGESVRILTYDKTNDAVGFLHLSFECEARFVPYPLEGGWDGEYFCGQTKDVLSASDGSLWLGVQGADAVRFDGERFTSFNHLTDGSPLGCRAICEGMDGRIFVIARDGLHVYAGESVMGTQSGPRVRPVREAPEPVWRNEAGRLNAIRNAWVFGDVLVCHRWDKGTLLAFDVDTGRELWSFELPDGNQTSIWAASGPDTGEMELIFPDRITTIRAADGETVRTLDFRCDVRINPIPYQGDTILAEGYRADSFVRMDRSGELMWRCDLPGYLMRHPVVFGSLMVLQTRGSSYGDQATCAVNLDTGELIWRDVVDAYGGGVAFGDDAVFLVETDTWLSPEMGEGWLIGRDPYTGERNWHERRKGTMIDHAPVVDRESGRVFAVSDDGTVVCAEGATGEMIWETVLPVGPLGAPAASYDPYWPCLTLADGYLAIADLDSTIHVLNAATGEPLVRLGVTEDLMRRGRQYGEDKVVATPWILDGRLIVVTSAGVAAYALPDILSFD